MERVVKKAQGITVDGGAHFCVVIFDSYVIKIPWKHRRKKFPKKRLNEIAACHNDLADLFPGVLPCYSSGDYLMMPKAPGVHVPELENDEQRTMMDRIQDLKKGAKRHGWNLKDVKYLDAFYERTTDTVYVVDFSSVERVRR